MNYLMNQVLIAAGAGAAGEVSASGIITTIFNIIGAFIIGSGAYMAIMGAIEYFKGKGDQNPAAKQHGSEQMIGGIAVAVLGLVAWPMITSLILSYIP